MKIGILQASSQKKINPLLYTCTQKAIQETGCELHNFGILETEPEECTYVQTAFLACLLLESGSVDFIVTGCSSGQGMMLACNSFPGVICGYAPTPQDAYLFGRINAGNAVSLPLGLNFGWSGELNLQYTLNALFESPFGIGYPPQDAQRKQKDTNLLKTINRTAKLSLSELLPQLDPDFIKSCLARENVYTYILEHGKVPSLAKLLSQYIS